MKKAFALLGTLLIFLGAKSQTSPAVKKETVKPGAVQPIAVNDSTKNLAVKQAANIHKADHVKKSGAVQIKENPQMKQTPVKMKEATIKPHKD